MRSFTCAIPLGVADEYDDLFAIRLVVRDTGDGSHVFFDAEIEIFHFETVIGNRLHDAGRINLFLAGYLRKKVRPRILDEIK